MSQATTFSLPLVLKRVLTRYRRRSRIVSLQRGLLLALGATLAATGLAIAADRLLRLEPTMRLTALIAIAALLAGAIIYWVLLPLLARITNLDAAIRVGRHHPGMQEDLVTAVELTQADETGISAGLVHRVLTDVSRQAEGRVDYRRAVPLRPLMVAVAIFATVGGTLSAAYALRPEAISNALARIFKPNSGIPFFSYTKLNVEPGDQVVRMGDSATVRIALGGEIPESARLETRVVSRGESWNIACADGAGYWNSGPLFEDVYYRVHAGDAISPSSGWYRIRVLAPPSLSAKMIGLIDPPYADSVEHEPADINGPQTIVAGTQIRLLGRPADRGNDNRLSCTGRMWANEQELPLTVGPDGLLSSPLLSPAEKVEYIIRLADGYGLESSLPDRIQVLPVADEKPRVRIVTPAANLILLPGEAFEVVAEGEDEFGMRALTLSWRRLKRGADKQLVPDEQWTESPLAEGGTRKNSLSGSQTMLLAAMGIEGGEVVEYRAHAADYAGDAFLRQGFSATHRVVVMTHEEHLELVTRELNRLEMEIRQAAAVQGEVAKQADAAAEAAGEKGSDEAAAKAADLANRERSEQSRAESIADRLERLAKEAARNSAIPAKSLQGMANMAEAVRDVGKDEVKGAEQNFSEAAKSKAGSAGEPGESKPGKPSDGDPQQGPQIKDGATQARKAQRRLENLADNARQLRRQTILEKLADDAERLAQRQTELKEATIAVATKTASLPREQLSAELNAVLTVLTVAERAIQLGVERLEEGIDNAALMLVFDEPGEAVRARKAHGLLVDHKVHDKVTEILTKMETNVLFSPLPIHDAVAASLREVAKALRQEQHDLDQVEKTIAEFIRRQKEINASIRAGISGKVSAEQSQALGTLQATLAREVKEEAAALNWLAMEIRGFRSLSVEKLTAAASEMNEGAIDIFGSALPPALEHGLRALALLEEAAQAFKNEKEDMQEGRQQKMNMELLIKL